jgi:hypothetical protein
MSKKILIIIFLISSQVGINYGLVPTDWYYGRFFSYTSTLSLATGGAVLFEPSAINPNPLSRGAPYSIISAAYNIGTLNERRTRYLYDQFDNTMGEIAVTENTFSRGKLGLFKCLLPWRFFNLELRLIPYSSFDYYFYQEFRDDYYTKIGEEELKLQGDIYNATILVGREWADKLGMGGGINYLFGKRNYYYQRIITGGVSVPTVFSSTPKGIGFTIGISYTPFERLNGIIYYNHSVALKDLVSDGRELKYPSVLQFNLSYLAPSEIPTKLGVYLSYANLTHLDPKLDKSYKVGLGVEHTMLNLVSLSYGFRIESAGLNSRPVSAIFCLGGTFDIKPAKCELGIEISRRELLPENFTIPNMIEADKIYENIINILMGIKLPFEKL